MTPEDDGITFDVDRLTVGSAGQIEIAGRWYGVRGRRFVRPSLTLTLKHEGGERRVLADLEHKPWAAQDGDAWFAAFPFDGELEGAERIELAVAPDITVELAGGSGRRVNTGRSADLRPAGSTRSPVIRDDPARPRPRAPRSPEIVRLRERLAVAESLITRERTRRQAADEALEGERQSARTLQAEVGRLRAELDLAGAVQRELDTASTGLDDLRGQARELHRERDQIAGERDDAQRELARERVETQRLASQLADAEAAVRRLTQAGREAQTPDPHPGPIPARGESRPMGGAERSESRPAGGAARGEGPPISGATRRESRPAGGALSSGDAGRGWSGPSRGGDASHEGGGANGETERMVPNLLPRTERPLNPSLRGSNWLGRGIALVVIAIVVVAIIAVINSTIS